MSSIRRRLRAAAFVLFGLAAAGTGALAQNETSNTIGPPQLKDFSLPGQRTTPPATPPATATAPPASTVPRATPDPAPRRDIPTATTRPRPEPAERAPAPAATAPQPRDLAPPGGEVPAPPAADPAPAAPLPAPVLPADAAPAPEGASWLWPALGGALVLGLAGFLYLRRRRSFAERDRVRESARDELGGALAKPVETAARPAPAAPLPAAPAPKPLEEAPAAPRAWIELDIVPDRAAATESEAIVHYALTLTNKGEVGARNLRIDPRLFNASAEGDMMAFFQGPIHEQSGSPQIVIAPGASLKLNGQVAMPMAELEAIEIAGRRIFVPMVAINVAYDWGLDGSGRTSRAWLVGREAETPSAKMGPFRLDLGPRIYRSVGRREARAVMV